MKKIFAIFGLALAMLTAGCAKDATEDVAVGGKVTLGVGIENTRTSLGALNGTQHPILWSEGDKIAVNGVASSAVDAKYAGTSYAQFEVAGVTAPYSILYPAEILGADGNITVATEQAYTANSFASGSAVMVGYAEANPVTLHNLYSFVKVTVAKGDDVALKSVTLTALGGEAISGTFAVDYKAATIAPLSGKDLIRVSSADGIPYVDGKASVIIAVPAGEYAKGFSVKVVDAAGKAMEKKAYTTAGVTVPAGVLLNMPEFTYTGVAQSVISVTNAAELQAALALGTAEAPVNVVIENDIDMADGTYVSAVEFYGVLDGQGYSFKNWNATRGLIATNYGVVKNIVIDASCTLNYTVAEGASGDQNAAFIVENNNVIGTVSGCVNKGNVIIADVSCGAHRAGGVVGVSYGFINDCINYGKIDVTSQAVKNNQMVGGVVGYINTNASTKDALGKDFLANCINYGEVKVLFPCQPKSAFVGGVLGATQMAKSSAAVYQGQIVDCINYGKVSYRFETLSSGTYGNVGGVIGYAQANLSGCDNHGEVSFTTPAEDLTQGGTRPALGGVVGSNIFKTVSCNNYGKVYSEGVWAAGTQDNSGAGSQGGSTFAGVAGCTGVYNVYSSDYNVEDCHNYGEVEIYNYCKIDGGTKGWYAGVVGYTTGDVKNCSNEGIVNLNHKVYESYSAGVVGETKGGVYNCSSNGPVTVDVMNVSKAGGAIYLAGVVGYSTTVVENCHLNADFSAKTNNADGSLRFAGIVGQIKTASTRSQTISNCSVKDGVKLSFVTDNGKANYCGGIIGLANNGIKDCVNGGDIDIKITELFEDGDITYVAGIAAAQQEDMNGCTNNGDITVDMFNSTGVFYAATVLADNKKANANFSACHNTGNLTIVNAGNTENIGIYVGHNVDDTAIVDESACTNTGVVTVNGQPLGGGAAEALTLDGKRWQLPADICEAVFGAPNAVLVADLGVSTPGQLMVLADYESIYGAQAAGMWAPMTAVAYTVEPTDATSGNVVLMQTDMFGDVNRTNLPYSNLTADSVVIDFTGMLGMPGSGPCSLYTGEVNLNGGGVAM